MTVQPAEVGAKFSIISKSACGKIVDLKDTNKLSD